MVRNVDYYIGNFYIYNDTYTCIQGFFHDKNGNDTNDLTKSEIIDINKFRETISNQPFRTEVLAY